MRAYSESCLTLIGREARILKHCMLLDLGHASSSFQIQSMEQIHYTPLMMLPRWKKYIKRQLG